MAEKTKRKKERRLLWNFGSHDLKIHDELDPLFPLSHSGKFVQFCCIQIVKKKTLFQVT